MGFGDFPVGAAVTPRDLQHVNWRACAYKYTPRFEYGTRCWVCFDPFTKHVSNNACYGWPQPASVDQGDERRAMWGLGPVVRNWVAGVWP